MSKESLLKMYGKTSVTDSYGVVYNADGTMLIDCVNKNLCEYTVREGTRYICEYAFDSCKKLERIQLADSVTNINHCAFTFCRNLKSITLSKSLEFIALFTAFNGCRRLMEINVPEGNKVFSSVDGVLFWGSNTHLILFPPGRPDNRYIVPDTVKYIGPAFYCHHNQHEIVIPDSVETIGLRAFASCFELKSVTIGKSVKHIADYAFGDCKKLTSITIPKSVERMDNDVFVHCSKKLIIRCEAESQPEGWNKNWNHGHRPVVWGVKK